MEFASKCPHHNAAGSSSSTEPATVCENGSGACPEKCPAHKAAETTPAAADAETDATGLASAVEAISLTPEPNSHPAPVKWAQRMGSLYLTIPMPEVTDAAFQFNDNGLIFKGTSHGQPYHLNLTFVSTFSQHK